MMNVILLYSITCLSCMNPQDRSSTEIAETPCSVQLITEVDTVITRLSDAEISEKHLSTVFAFFSCFGHFHSNAELEEYASDVLFRLIRSHPEISVWMLAEQEELPLKTILELLATPVNDMIDLEAVCNSIAGVPDHEATKQLMMDALKEGMDKLK